MIITEQETPETLLIQKENRAELYAAIELLQYAQIVKHYLQCGNYAAVWRKYDLCTERIRQIYFQAELLIIKRLKEKTNNFKKRLTN